MSFFLIIYHLNEHILVDSLRGNPSTEESSSSKMSNPGWIEYCFHTKWILSWKSKTTVTAYLSSKQLLFFALQTYLSSKQLLFFALQYRFDVWDKIYVWCDSHSLIMSPLYWGGDILLYFSPLICSSDQFCAFSQSIMQAIKHETLTQIPGYCWPTVYDAGAIFSYKLRYIAGFWLVEMAISTNQKPTIYRNLYENTGPEPTLVQYWVNVSCLTPRWMWPAPATLTQHLPDIGSVSACTAWPAADRPQLCFAHHRVWRY